MPYNSHHQGAEAKANGSNTTAGTSKKGKPIQVRKSKVKAPRPQKYLRNARRSRTISFPEQEHSRPAPAGGPAEEAHPFRFGGWQSPLRDREIRRHMVECVAITLQMLHERSTTASPPPRQEQLLRYTVKVEEILYQSAIHREEYLDQSTLKMRLQFIANGLLVARSSLNAVK